MPEKITLTYYFSDMFPDLGFDTEEEAKAIDSEVIKYLNDEACIKDFVTACRQYASIYAIECSIKYDFPRFCSHLSTISDSLITTCENASYVVDDSDFNVYCSPFMYILNMLNIEPKYKKYWKY